MDIVVRALLEGEETLRCAKYLVQLKPCSTSQIHSHILYNLSTHHGIGHSCHGEAIPSTMHSVISCSTSSSALDHIVVERVSNFCEKYEIRRAEGNRTKSPHTFLQEFKEWDVQEVIFALVSVSPIGSSSLPLTPLLSASRFRVAIASRLGGPAG